MAEHAWDVVDDEDTDADHGAEQQWMIDEPKDA
jgi:hypothetical protein